MVKGNLSQIGFYLTYFSLAILNMVRWFKEGGDFNLAVTLIIIAIMLAHATTDRIRGC